RAPPRGLRPLLHPAVRRLQPGRRPLHLRLARILGSPSPSISRTSSESGPLACDAEAWKGAHVTTTTEAPPEQTDALVERLFAATIDALEIASVHVGGQLGFYRALADGGDATPADLAGRTGTAERYAREWLEQQAVAGFLS